MKPVSVQRYDVIRLHRRSEQAWAVTALPGGWIVADGGGALLMRLLERDARDIAAAMTEALSETKTERSEGWLIYDRA